MSFELINTFTTFQISINDVLQKFLNIFVVIYLDDILIYSKTEEDYKKHVRQMFRVLKNVDLLIQLKKCKFNKQKVKFLEYILITSEIQMNEFKIKTVMN